MPPETIFLDIDGCLLKQTEPVTVQAKNWSPGEILPGTIEKLVEWEQKGCKIILTTGRKNCYRKFTVWQLRKAGIFYDRLIMNDSKPGNPTPKATAFELPRNEGISSINLNDKR